MNKRAKGKLLVSKVVKLLESWGWMVEVCRPRLMFIGPGRVIQKEEDFFGAWDIWAFRKEPEGNFVTRLIQVSTIENLSSKKKQVQNFPSGYGLQELWLWVSGRGCHFRTFQAGPLGFVETTDKDRILK